MVKKKYEIVWSKRAKDSLQLVYQFIKRDSVKAASKVKNKIIHLVNTLSDSPEKFAENHF